MTHASNIRPPIISSRRTVLAFIVGVVVLAVIAARSVDLVEALSRNIPQERPAWDYVAGLTTALVLGATIILWPTSYRDRSALLLLWLVKCVVTLGLMLPYEWHYGLDAYGYFDAARQSAPPVDAGFGSGTRNIEAITWYLGRVMPHSYHALKVVFSLVGLIGIYLIYRAAVRFAGREDRRMLFLIALFPSCLFWSSILGKDPVQLLGVGLYVFGVVGWVRTKRFGYVIPCAVGILLSTFIRVWTGPMLVSPLIVFAFSAVRGTGAKLVFVLAFGGIFAFALTRVADLLRVETAKDVLATTEQLSRTAGWEGGSDIRPPDALTGVGPIVRFAPIAMFTALFRPLPGELLSPFGALASLENGVLIVLVGVAVARYRKGSMREPVIMWAVLLILAWSLVYGLTVFNLGSLVRFKLQVLPLMLLVLFYIGRIGERWNALPMPNTLEAASNLGQ